MKILSIDVGGTRIKASIIKSNYTLHELESAKIKAFRNIGWLNQNLPNIVNPDVWGSITNDDSFKNYDKIAIDGPWNVDQNKINGWYVDEFKIPADLNKEMYKVSKKEVITNQNDARAWLKGMIKYQNLIHKKTEAPVLALIFGTGMGCSYTENPCNLKSVEGIDPNNILKPHCSEVLPVGKVESVYIDRMEFGVQPFGLACLTNSFPLAWYYILAECLQAPFQKCKLCNEKGPKNTVRSRHGLYDCVSKILHLFFALR